MPGSASWRRPTRPSPSAPRSARMSRRSCGPPRCRSGWKARGWGRSSTRRRNSMRSSGRMPSASARCSGARASPPTRSAVSASGFSRRGHGGARMQAMVLETARAPLRMRELPTPVPAAREILLEVAACGVCRTDLHVVDGELPNPTLPLIPGHEIVGRVAALGADVAGFAVGERIGVPWLGYTCGVCPYCRAGRENLCDRPLFTGYTRDGGYATHTLADARFCFPLPERRDDAEIAPFLCAGLIGWRSYRMAGAQWKGQGAGSEGESLKALGLYGFG